MKLQKGSMVHHRGYNEKVEIISQYSDDVYRVKYNGLIVFATLWIHLVPRGNS